MIRTKPRYTMMLIAGCLAASPASAASAASAQRAPGADASVSDTVAAPTAGVLAPAGGPRLESTAIAMRHRTSGADPVMVQRVQPMSVGKPMALMVVGGAAIVLGAVIGGDVGTLFMVGGSVSALIGLYQYLK